MEGQGEAGHGFTLGGTGGMTMPWFMCTLWVPKFAGEEGSTKFGEWRAQMQAMLRAQGLTEIQQVEFDVGALEGCARREVLLVPAERRKTVALVWALLEEIFSRPVPLTVVHSHFFQCRQGLEESLETFLLWLREVHAGWQTRELGDKRVEDEILRDQFLLGLPGGPIKQELQRQVRRRPAT